uniref:HAMP domain-containing protein n=1 Tax=Demequina salsinemoris TaxID=577470 RepID=UPI000A828EA6
MDNAVSSRRGPRFSLAAQLFTAVGTVVAALAVVGLVSVTTLHSVVDDNADLLEAKTGMSESIASLTDALWEARATEYHLNGASDSKIPSLVEDLQKSQSQFEEEFTTFVADYEATFGEEVFGLDLINATWEGYKAAVLSVWVPTDGVEPASDATITGYDITITSLIEEFNYAIDTRIDARTADSAASADSVTWLVTGLLIAGIAVGVTVGWWTTRRITRAAAIVKRSLEAMATGDLTLEATVTSKDEMGEMAESLTKAQGALRETMAEVIDSAQTVAA